MSKIATSFTLLRMDKSTHFIKEIESNLELIPETTLSNGDVHPCYFSTGLQLGKSAREREGGTFIQRHLNVYNSLYTENPY